MIYAPYHIWTFIFSFCDQKDVINVLRTGDRMLFESYIYQMTSNCNSEQRAIYRTVCFGNRKQDHMILGLAGTGKTFLLKLIEMTSTFFGLDVHIMAFTGLAAQNAGGETLHKVFPLSHMDHKEDAPLFKKINGLILLDEISMISDVLLNQIMDLQKDSRCQWILFGDFLQLTPIPEPNQKIPGFMFESKHFHRFKIHMLTKPQRQADSLFLNIIHHLAKNEWNVEVEKFLKERQDAFQLLTKEQQFTKLYLFHDQKRVDKRNNECFQRVVSPIHFVPIIPLCIKWTKNYLAKNIPLYLFTSKEKKQASHFDENETKLLNRILKEHQLHDLELKIGCWIMFRRNIYHIPRVHKIPCKNEHSPIDMCLHSNDLVIRNGTRALIHGIESKGLWIQLESDNEIVYFPKQNLMLSYKRVKKTNIKQQCLVRMTRGPFQNTIGRVQLIMEKYAGISFGKSDEIITFPLHQIQVIPRLKIYYFVVSCYPCHLAYALTIVKAQGLTLDNVVLHLYQVPTPNLIYVAISRVKQIDNLFLNGAFTKPRQNLDPKLLTFYDGLFPHTTESDFWILVQKDLAPQLLFQNGKWIASTVLKQNKMKHKMAAIRFLFYQCRSFCEKEYPQYKAHCVLRKFKLFLKKKKPNSFANKLCTQTSSSGIGC